MGKQERIIIVEPEKAPVVAPDPAQDPLFEPAPVEPDLTPAAVE